MGRQLMLTLPCLGLRLLRRLLWRLLHLLRRLLNLLHLLRHLSLLFSVFFETFLEMHWSTRGRLQWGMRRRKRGKMWRKMGRINSGRSGPWDCRKY